MYQHLCANLELGRARVQSYGEKVEQQHMNEAVYSSATSPDKINKYVSHSTKNWFAALLTWQPGTLGHWGS